MNKKRKTWFKIGLVVAIASIGVLSLLFLSGIAFAIGFGVLLAVLNPIVGSMASEKPMMRLRNREAELRKSWDEFRVKGKLLYYPEWVGRRLIGVGFILAGFMVFMVVILAIAISADVIPASPSQNRSVLGVFVVIAAALLIVPWITFIQVTKTGHEVSSLGLRRGSPWARSFYVSWGEVKEVSYSSLTDSFVVTTDKGKVKVRSVLDGIDFFKEMVLTNVPLERRASLGAK